MSEPFGTRPVMHRLWQYTYKLLCSVHSIAFGCPQEKEEKL